MEKASPHPNGTFHFLLFNNQLLNSSSALSGAGYTFGKDVVTQFLRTNKLEHIVRSHQLCMDGYQVVFNDALSTVWSAPNYCYRCGNVAAIMEVAEDFKRRYNTFLAAPEAERKTPNIDFNKEAPDYFT